MKDNNLDSTFKNKAEKLSTEVRPKIWDKLEKRMDDHYASTTPAQIVSIAWTRYAAAFALLIGAGFLLSQLDTGSSSPMVYRFTIEEMSQPVDEDQVYEEMVQFSQKYYHTLINPGAKKKSSL